MIKRSLLTLAILFPAALILGASAASAQGLAHWRSDEKGLEARRVRTLVSETEVAYLDNLTLTLGSADEWSPVELAYGPDDLQATSERDPRLAPVRLVGSGPRSATSSCSGSAFRVRSTRSASRSTPPRPRARRLCSKSAGSSS